MSKVTLKSEKTDFNAGLAFSRSLGWLTEEDYQIISKLRIGIVGLGGVGGQYAEIFARLGVQNFSIFDGDKFEIENSNRQNECKVSNYGRNKAEVIAELICDINPNAKVDFRAAHIQREQIQSFCENIDIYVDSLDFFEVDLRRDIFKKMQEFGKPCITLAPVGTGAASLVFTKDSMSFEDYFGFHTTNDILERSILFLLGVAPSLMHSRYIQDQSRVDFRNRCVPSLPIGVYSCASFAATIVLKLALGRGKLYMAPYSVHYDPYLQVIKKKYVWLGYRNPLQRLKFFILRRIMKKRQ